MDTDGHPRLDRTLLTATLNCVQQDGSLCSRLDGLRMAYHDKGVDLRGLMAINKMSLVGYNTLAGSTRVRTPIGLIR